MEHLPKEFPNLPLLRHGVETRFKIRVRSLELSVRPLSILEEDQVTQEVIDELEKVSPQHRTSMKETILIAIKKLELASSSDIGVNDAKLRSPELARMTPGEIDALFKQWVAGCEKFSPMFERLKPEEVRDLVASLKKNTKEQATILTELSFLHLVSLSEFLLNQGESPTAS
jgi:hypothetical protein